MNYKSLLLILLIVVLVVVLAYNRKELFQNNSTENNKFCDGENDVKYVIFHPINAEKVRKNAKAIACNVKQYEDKLKMFVFDGEKSSIAVSINEAYTLTLSCKLRGTGPVMTGNDWAIVTTIDKLIFETATETLQLPKKKNSETFVEIGYDKFEKILKVRVDRDDTTAKEVKLENTLDFKRFDIGKDESLYFDGYIGSIMIEEKMFNISTQEERSGDDFDKLLNFLLKIDTEAFQDFNGEEEVEHFQSNLQRPQNFNTVKMKYADDNEMKYIENKVNQTFGDFEASSDASNAVKLSKVLIYLGIKFIKGALSKKLGEYTNFSSVVEVPKLKCRDSETLNACFYYNDSLDIPAFKFNNNPIDGAVSIKSKLESFISQALSAGLVKDYLNSSEEKTSILNDIKTKINGTLKELQNRFSDAFFIYYELDFNQTADDYTFYLKSVDALAPDVFMGESNESAQGPSQEPTQGPDRPREVVTTQASEMYPDDDVIERVLKCDFNAYGENKSSCIKKCMDNKNVNNCDFDACYNICEKCENKSYCRWLQDIKQNVVNQACDFDANENNTSPSEFECISLCQESGNDSCSKNICKNTCSTCSNEETCPWVKEAREFASDLQNIDYPSAPVVTGVPGDRKITLKWNVSSTGGADIEKFIFMVFKTNNHSEGMRVETAVNTVESMGGGVYTHSIESLENGVNYTVSLAAVNKRGLSSMSKPVVLKPFKFEDEIQVENTLDSSNIIQMQRDQLVTDIMTKIEKNDYNNLKNEINEVQKIEESLKESKDNNLFSQLRKIGTLNLSVNN